MGKLAIDYLSEEGSSTLIFEPSELIDFKMSWDWQKQWQKRLLEKPFSQQAVWMLQHYECYTLGRGADEENLLFNSKKPPLDLYRVDRGGEVTCHLPGQLVVYLVLDLHRYKTDLNWYLRELENILLEVLRNLGLSGYTVHGKTGVWVGGAKVAAIGIGCRRWVTQHGLALNVDCNLERFDWIIPCGLRGYGVENLSSFIPGLKMKDVQPFMKKAVKQHFYL